MKILIAEDSLGMRKVIASMLQGFGYDDLLLAEDGEQALKTAATVDRLDLLLTNWDMPVIDGLTPTCRSCCSPPDTLRETSSPHRKPVLTAISASPLRRLSSRRRWRPSS